MITRSWRRGAAPRSTIALVVAAAAVVLAVAGALAPARKLQSHYTWPPRTLPADRPARQWYTPLLLARHTPASISARLPCGGRPLPEAARPLVVLSTARQPDAPNALAVTRDGKALTVTIGGAKVAAVDLPNGSCTLALSFAGGSWSLTGASVIKNGAAPMPDVDGLYSGLDLRAGSRPVVAVTTGVYGTRTTVTQTVLRILALLAALAALALVTPLPRLGRVRLPRPGLVDGTVVALLLVWWVIGPSYFDDGWIMAGERNFLATGNFSAYYDSFGVASSIQYWLLWLQHFVFEASSSLVILRLPALVCLVVMWFGCRWIAGRTVPQQSAAVRWSLAAMFCVGAFAWGMTLRPEPEVALLVLGVAACIVAFLESRTTLPLAVAALLVALAVTAHPAGLLSLAPVLVAAPALIGWARARPAAAGAIVLAAVAVAAVLVVLGTDAAQFRTNVRSLRAHGAETAGWRDELTRYELLARPLYGPPMRRLWVAIAVLTVVAYVLRRRVNGGGLFAPALGIGFVLLIVTPAKIPWHFGTLIGLAALAVAEETARLVAARQSGWRLRPFVVAGAAIVAAAWAWSPRNAWSDLDLRRLSWTLGVERHVTFAKLAALVPLLVLAAFALRSGLRRLDIAAWRAAAWTVPALAVPLVAFTFGVLIDDTAKTSSWTLARQNLDALRGDTGCGLADDAVVPSLPSMRPLETVGPAHGTNALPQAPVTGLARYEVGPAPAQSPWFRLPQGGHVGFFTTGDAGGDSLRVEWGRTTGDGVRALGADSVADASLGDPSPGLVAWRFFPRGSLPARPAEADALRVVLDPAVAPGGAIGLTTPVTYDDEPLRTRLERSDPALALPNLFTYVPCARQPALHGIAEIPRLLVAQQGTMWPIGTGSSPFDALPDVYNLVRLPLSDSAHPPADVVVYAVVQHVTGAAVAPVG